MNTKIKAWLLVLSFIPFLLWSVGLFIIIRPLNTVIPETGRFKMWLFTMSKMSDASRILEAS